MLTLGTFCSTLATDFLNLSRFPMVTKFVPLSLDSNLVNGKSCRSFDLVFGITIDINLIVG